MIDAIVRIQLTNELIRICEETGHVCPLWKEKEFHKGHYPSLRMYYKKDGTQDFRIECHPNNPSLGKWADCDYENPEASKKFKKYFNKVFKFKK